MKTYSILLTSGTGTVRLQLWEEDGQPPQVSVKVVTPEHGAILDLSEGMREAIAKCLSGWGQLGRMDFDDLKNMRAAGGLQ